jgi:hypothetical protein
MYFKYGEIINTSACIVNEWQICKNPQREWNMDAWNDNQGYEIAKEIEEEFKDSTSELKNENVEYKFLSRYYLVNKQNKKYDSLFDKDMKLKGGI